MLSNIVYSNNSLFLTKLHKIQLTLEGIVRVGTVFVIAWLSCAFVVYFIYLCRLIPPKGSIKLQGYGCSLFKALRDLDLALHLKTKSADRGDPAKGSPDKINILTNFNLVIQG